MIDFELVDPQFVEDEVINGRGTGRFVVLEAHFSSIDHPLDGDISVTRHIPGAIQIHPSYLEAGIDTTKYYPFYECPEDGSLMPRRKLVDAVERIGITPDTPVVVYGTEPDGAMAAARLIWGLFYAGVKSIRLLDGGLNAWLAHGGTTTASILKANEVAASGSRRPGKSSFWRTRPDIRATTAEVRKISSSGKGRRARLVDVRRPGEFAGTMPHCYPFFARAGHIPNALLQGNWDNLVDSETHRIGPRLEEVRRRWLQAGIVDSRVEQGRTCLVFYCGTGWRSSLSFLAALLLGFRARNYDGGFYGWSWNDENEIAFGSPP